MSFSVEGKTAIITGATGSAGLAVARHFADAEANVMMVDDRERDLRRERDQMPGGGTNVRYFAGEICQKLTVANLVSATIEAFERVDILVNASLLRRSKEPDIAQEAETAELFKHNVLANLHLTRQVARRMIRQAGDAGSEGATGSVVNICSIAPERTHPKDMPFSISCVSITEMTRSLATEFAKHGIRVNAVAAGSVMDAEFLERSEQSPQERDAAVRATPLGRIADASELAEVVQFLATSASGFVTGQTLTVDGGRTLVGSLDETPV